MAGFEGRWYAAARQATFNETPMRDVSPGSIADLVIEPNGRGHSYKKGLFGREKEIPFTWQVLTGNIFLIDMGGGMTLLSNWEPSVDVLTTAWTSPIKSIDGMAVYYKRA